MSLLPLRFSRRLTLFIVVLLLLIGVTAVTAGMFVSRSITPPETVVLQIEAGSGLSTIAKRLEKQGVIANARMFVFLARLRGDTSSVQAGDYEFTLPATPGKVLDRLVMGDVRRIQFTIPEGFTLRQIGERLAAQNIAPLDDFLALSRDEQFLANHDIQATSLEGYLFPETYTVIAKLPLNKLIETMLDQLNRQLTPELLAAATERNLTRHQLLTLASIVQKEAGNNDEMPLIAAVFHNRLRKGIPLQADPTVIYGLGDEFKGNITRAHLRRPTPYNTYTIRKLPPGPIASPGREALLATAYPADVDYIYFVARGDGTHKFSLTLKEHNQAVRKFQLKQ